MSSSIFPPTLRRRDFLRRPALFRGRRRRAPGPIRVWDVATGKQVQEFVPGGDVWYSSAQFLPGGKYLVACLQQNETTICISGISPRARSSASSSGHAQPPRFAVSPDGKRMLSWGDDRTVRLWDVETGKELRKLEGHTDKAAGVFSPDGKQVLTFSPDKTLRLWDVESGKELKKLEGPHRRLLRLLLPGRQTGPVLWRRPHDTALGSRNRKRSPAVRGADGQGVLRRVRGRRPPCRREERGSENSGSGKRPAASSFRNRLRQVRRGRLDDNRLAGRPAGAGERRTTVRFGCWIWPPGRRYTVTTGAARRGPSPSHPTEPWPWRAAFAPGCLSSACRRTRPAAQGQGSGK